MWSFPSYMILYLWLNILFSVNSANNTPFNTKITRLNLTWFGSYFNNLVTKNDTIKKYQMKFDLRWFFQLLCACQLMNGHVTNVHTNSKVLPYVPLEKVIYLPILALWSRFHVLFNCKYPLNALFCRKGIETTCSQNSKLSFYPFYIILSWFSRIPKRGFWNIEILRLSTTCMGLNVLLLVVVKSLYNLNCYQ